MSVSIGTDLQHFFTASLGMALAAPLLIQSMPFLRHVNWFFLLLVLCGLAFPLFNSTWRSRKTDFLFSLLLLIVFFYAVGIFRTDGLVPEAVWKDLARGCYIALLAAVVITFAKEPTQASLLVDWFLKSAAAIAIASAILGVVKYYLLMNGFHLTFLARYNPKDYPWGTSLANDYNFFALSLLIGASVLLHYWHIAKNSHTAFVWSLLFGLVVVVGAYAGSRRFWLAGPLIFMAQLLLYRYTESSDMQRPRWGILLIGFVCSAVSLYLILSVLAVTNQQKQTLPVVPEKGIVQQDQTYIFIERTSPSAMPSGLSYEARINSMFSEKIKFGMGSRLTRWHLAIDLIEQSKTPWLGSGFGYRYVFGCQIYRCGTEDYPHAPLLSALLYGGIIAFGLFIILILYALYLVVSGLRKTNESIVISLALLISLLFVLISGDTFLSMPIFPVLLILAHVATNIAKQKAI